MLEAVARQRIAADDEKVIALETRAAEERERLGVELAILADELVIDGDGAGRFAGEMEKAGRRIRRQAFARELDGAEVFAANQRAVDDPAQRHRIERGEPAVRAPARQRGAEFP